MSGSRTDLYEVRMALSYLRRDMCAPATFSLFVRNLPPSRGFLVATGLADCLTFLDEFRFTDAELEYLDRVTGMDVEPLRGLRFTGSVRAVPEGRVVFENEPLLEVTAPLPQAQLVKTALLNLVTYQTAVASKAARCRIAAAGREVADFAARRPPHAWSRGRVGGGKGVRHRRFRRHQLCRRRVAVRAHAHRDDGALLRRGVPGRGAAFEAFAEDFPRSTVFLVDTYESLQGVDRAVEVARRLPADLPIGVRLDSGDLWALSRETRKGVSADAPVLDSAYKLVEYDGRPVMKLSTGKVSTPGAKQVFRAEERPSDVLALREEETPDGHEPLLTEVVRDGSRTGPLRTDEELVRDAGSRLTRDLEWLPARALDLTDPFPARVRTSDRLYELTEHVRRSLHAQPTKTIGR